MNQFEINQGLLAEAIKLNYIKRIINLLMLLQKQI